MTPTQQTIKILIIDDDEDDYFIIADYLKSITNLKLEVDWCPIYKDGLEKAAANKYSIYLIDYRLSARTGIDLIEAAIAAGCESPLILLTGRGSSKIDQKAMEVGATDYLVKGELTAEKLERCIRYSLDRAANIKALKANENKFRSMFEKSTDSIFLCALDGKITQINQAGYMLLGCDEKEIPTCTIFDFIESKAQVHKLQAAIGNYQDINSEEITLLTKQGEKRFCLLTLSRETDANQQEYLQGILHDITERKQDENNALQTQKLAAAGRLMRTLAHEVRNPLNNINLSACHLATISEEDTKIYIDIIQRNSERINALITELLNSLRSTEMHFEKINLQDVIDELVATAQDSIRLKNVSISWSLPEASIYIKADKEKLKIALLNLINNAIDAVSDNSGKIIIKAHSNDMHHVLVLSDNGVGMNEEQLSRLFEPYYTTKPHGMGLGMVATLSIFQAHNAVVNVDSSIGKGSTFTIEFEIA